MRRNAVPQSNGSARAQKEAISNKHLHRPQDQDVPLNVFKYRRYEDRVRRTSSSSLSSDWENISSKRPRVDSEDDVERDTYRRPTGQVSSQPQGRRRREEGEQIRSNVMPKKTEAKKELDLDFEIKKEIRENIEKLQRPPKVVPTLKESGVLAEETNLKNGVLINYTIPPEARQPVKGWKLFVFKSTVTQPQCIRIDKQRCYLVGKDVRVVDLVMVHPTVSKQHAVICHQLDEKNEVKPYLQDLESTNGTFLNNEKIEPRKRYKLKEQDVITFAKSTREYVLLHDKLAHVDEVALEDVLDKNIQHERKLKARSARLGRYW